jgi:UDP-N-acetylmuramyl pentapeptide phosphotransferase/UDP-N-acetylglucosamine-1-phosphate transferase
MIVTLWESVAAFAFCVVGAGLVLVYSRRTGLVDVPNQRSSHSVPTPRGGGIALVASVLAVTAYEAITLNPEARVSVACGFLGVGLMMLMVVGWLDDHGWLDYHRSATIVLRLPFHLLCGLAAAALVNVIAPMPGIANIAWLAWWIFWTAASINIVNFMDGIDGMVSSQGLIYGIFLFALSPSGLAGRFGLVLAGACLGFLVWNWAPAKIFMGDVGSGPLGLLLVIGGALALEGAPAVLVFLPLFPLFFDALATIIIRFRAGEPVLHPHRDHLYQRVANSGVGHAFVSTIYALAAAIGAITAVSVRNASPLVVATSIAVYCATTVLAWAFIHARFSSRSPGASIG